MARNDDDDDERPSKKRDDDRDDDDQERSNRKRDDDDDEDDRPRKKNRAKEEDERTGAEQQSKPMPLRLTGAIIASMAWGILVLHASCVRSSSLSLLAIQMMREVRMGGIVIDMGAFGLGRGMVYTQIGLQLMLFLFAAALLASGITLLMRKSLGKWLAMGAPAGMVLIELLGFVICLIITEGAFLTQHNVEFFLNIVFSLAVSGLCAYLLLNKDVSKALK